MTSDALLFGQYIIDQPPSKRFVRMDRFTSQRLDQIDQSNHIAFGLKNGAGCNSLTASPKHAQYFC